MAEKTGKYRLEIQQVRATSSLRTYEMDILSMRAILMEQHNICQLEYDIFWFVLDHLYRSIRINTFVQCHYSFALRLGVFYCR